MLCASCTLLLHSYQRILSAAIIPQHLSIICRTHPLSVALIYHCLVHTVFAREPAEAAAEAKHLQRLLKLNLNLLPLALSPPPPPLLHTPGLHMLPSPDPCPIATWIAPKQCKSDVHVNPVSTLSARDQHWRNFEKEKSIRAQKCKSARVSPMTGSVPLKMAKKL